MANLPNNPPHEIPEKVNEPQAAYGLKADRPPIKSSPCQYTLEELNIRLDQAEKDVYNGRHYTTEEVRKMYPKWKLR